jgi:flavin-dependent dehydrogenase
MLERAAFDASLVEAARRAGAEIRLCALVTRIEPGGVILTAEGRRLRAGVIVGADGPRSRAGKAIGSANTELVETRQVTVPLCKPHAASDIFLSAAIPGGYGWLFPKQDVANLGAGVVPQQRSLLKAIVGRLHEELFRSERVGRAVLSATGGAIPVGGLVKPWGQLGAANVLLAGDAAGLAHPVTGAGIAAAVHSGRLAGQAAASGEFRQYAEELEDVYGAALARALRRRRELQACKPGKAALRRGWIAYAEYWQ